MRIQHNNYHIVNVVAHVAIMRSYCSAASLEDERNTVMSFLSALQILGYSIGPGMMYEPNLGMFTYPSPHQV